MGVSSRALSVLALAVVAGCGDGDEGLAWYGPEPHLVVDGFLFEEPVVVDVVDPVAVEAAGFECRREYRVPVIDGEPDLTRAQNVEVRIRGVVSVNGEDRRFELELKQHDLQGTPLGTVLDVVPRDDLRPPDPSGRTLWVEWEWHEAETNITTFEGAAQAGTVRLEAFTGTPGPEGVIIPDGDGYVGATVDAYWSPTERLRISVTAPCLDTEIVEYTP